MNRQTVSKDAMGLQKMKNHESGEVFIFMVSPTILHLVSRSRSRETMDGVHELVSCWSVRGLMDGFMVKFLDGARNYYMTMNHDWSGKWLDQS